MVARTIAAAMGAKQFAIARASHLPRCLRMTLVLIFFVSPSTWAINPANHISQYGHSAWRIQDGYFHGRIQAVTQTTDGYLWIGTVDGLLRFDGVSFVPWVPPPGQQLPSPAIESLLGAADGSLWIGTRFGLSHWRNGHLANFDLHGRFGSILEDSDHSVWVVYGDVGHTPLCHISETAVRCYEQSEGIPYPAEGGLIRDAAGNFWLSTRHGIARWRPDSFSEYNVRALRSFEGSDAVEAIAFGATGSILVGMARAGREMGLQQFMIDSSTWKPYVKPGLDAARLPVATLFVDREGSLWLGTLEQGLFRVHGDNVEHFGAADGLTGDFIRKFYEDREGNFWVITSKGVDLFRNLRVASFSTREGVGTEEVESVLASRDGTIWVGGAESFDAIRDERVSSIRLGKGLPGEQVGALFEDHAGRLWVGVDQKLFIYQNGGFKPITRSDGSPVGSVKSITEDRDNNIWVSTWQESVKGLLRIRDFKVEEELWNPQIPPFRQVVADSEGALWLSPVSGGLARLNHGHMEAIVFEGMPDSFVEQLMIASDGSVLGATASGVVAWKKNSRRILTEQDGLPCNGVHGLINDARGNLWLNLQCGLVEITDGELKKWWENSAPLHPRVFDTFDGAQAGRAFWNAAARSPDGRLWFANGTVLQMIDPAQLPENELAPPVHVERIVADRHSYAPENGVTVPALTRDLEIDYTALSFGVPQKVFFRYKLEGRDTNWTEAATRRQAFYSDLRPGRYRFRVIACNSDGFWNEAGASLDFSILPAYYQRTWFGMACGGASLIVLWILYQFRVRQLHRGFAIGLEARVNERTRIARELHDTLLQTLHGLMFQFQGVRNLLPRRPDDAIRSLDEAISETKKALAESRDAIQGLRLEPMATGNLADLLMSASRELASSGSDPVPPVFDLIEEGEPRMLSPAARNEICRIALEILRNAYRHAHARRIEAEIRYGDPMLRLRIRDDGKGIDPKVLKEGGRAGHWGLRGMRERAERIGTRLDFWSELGEGTEVELAIPAALAYESARDGYRAKLLRKVNSRAQRS